MTNDFCLIVAWKSLSSHCKPAARFRLKAANKFASKVQVSKAEGLATQMDVYYSGSLLPANKGASQTMAVSGMNGLSTYDIKDGSLTSTGNSNCYIYLQCWQHLLVAVTDGYRLAVLDQNGFAAVWQSDERLKVNNYCSNVHYIRGVQVGNNKAWFVGEDMKLYSVDLNLFVDGRCGKVALEQVKAECLTTNVSLISYNKQARRLIYLDGDGQIKNLNQTVLAILKPEPKDRTMVYSAMASHSDYLIVARRNVSEDSRSNSILLYNRGGKFLAESTVTSNFMTNECQEFTSVQVFVAAKKTHFCIGLNNRNMASLFLICKHDIVQVAACFSAEINPSSHCIYSLLSCLVLANDWPAIERRKKQVDVVVFGYHLMNRLTISWH